MLFITHWSLFRSAVWSVFGLHSQRSSACTSFFLSDGCLSKICFRTSSNLGCKKWALGWNFAVVRRWSWQFFNMIQIIRFFGISTWINQFEKRSILSLWHPNCDQLTNSLVGLVFDIFCFLIEKTAISASLLSNCQVGRVVRTCCRCAYGARKHFPTRTQHDGLQRKIYWNMLNHLEVRTVEDTSRNRSKQNKRLSTTNLIFNTRNHYKV